MIGQRLNRLSEVCNRALTTASVIGWEFDFGLLREVSGGDEGELLDAVDEALESHVIEEAPEAFERHQFSHTLIQQTLVERLSASRRVRLHAGIAQSLERMYGDNVDSHASELAHHCAQAEPVIGAEKLVRYSLMAGEQALSAYAWEDALSHFERALAAKEVTQWMMRQQEFSSDWERRDTQPLKGINSIRQ